MKQQQASGLSGGFFEAVDIVDSLKLIERAGGLPVPLTPPHARLFLAAKGFVYSL